MYRVKSVLAHLAHLMAQTLFPPSCCACQRNVASMGLCARCWRGIRFLERPWCDRLGIPFMHDRGPGMVSVEAISDPPGFARARAAVAYEGAAMQIVRGLKFHDRSELAPMMAGWMVRVGAELAADADFVVPVPLHRRRMLQRRYNQAAELARAFSQICRVPYAPGTVERFRITRQQIGLDARQRQTNVRGAFRVPDGARERVNGRRALVIDDVYTTGATVSAVAAALIRAGAQAVDVLTFARVLPEGVAV